MLYILKTWLSVHQHRVINVFIKHIMHRVARKPHSDAKRGHIPTMYPRGNISLRLVRVINSIPNRELLDGYRLDRYKHSTRYLLMHQTLNSEFVTKSYGSPRQGFRRQTNHWFLPFGCFFYSAKRLYSTTYAVANYIFSLVYTKQLEPSICRAHQEEQKLGRTISVTLFFRE